ncbi:hypothetical protein [Agrobacterium tumefaciens]|uniref:hypothetical protein n=1 Tax=Agrobacterium tumefaciens TaxID=358 RepID=UPI001CBDD187|nr:hypothetical protein [Agrobacterium tumefaciens]
MVTDEMVSKEAVAMCLKGGFDPYEAMPNDGPRWKYYVDGARAALEAALSAAEPVAWRYSFKGGKWTVQKNKPNWFKEGMPDVEIEPLFIASSTQQPAPSVAVKALTDEDILAGIKDQRFGYVVQDGKLTVGTDRRIGIDLKEFAVFLSRSALSAQVQDVAEERYRHKKRGSTYTVMARGRLQVDGDLDNEKVVVYRGEDGQTWVRPEYEFNDGRFEPLPAAPAKQEGGHD